MKEIRDLCIFARHDVTHDPPFSRLDLVSCRNLLIYLDEVAQRRIMQAFHFALRPHGMLMIGPAETIGQSSELFEQVDKRARIYRRRPGSGPGMIGQQTDVTRPASHVSLGGDVHDRGDKESLSREADRWMLARFAPASLLVDEGLTIRQFRGKTGPFLEPASGAPSMDLQRVIRPELLVELLPAIRQARESGLMVHCDAIRMHDEGDVSIEVVPLSNPVAGQGFLILLDDGSHPARSARPKAVPEQLTESEKDRRLAQLQYQIDSLRDFVRVSMEEHGAIQEELKSAHEEMLSANEEYQSTNEELETSKEELQSTNEELTTTIEELRNRNRDLANLNAELDQARQTSERAKLYADSIIETVRMPLAVIDGEGRVRRVNRAFLEEMEVPEEKVEHLTGFGSNGGGKWTIPGLIEKLKAVFRDGSPMDDWQVTLDLPRRGRRTLSLTARRIPGDKERENLVLLAVDDITDREKISADLLANSHRKDEFLAMLAHELRHPLTPIVHAIHLLRLAATDAATDELYEMIDTQSQRLVRFVNELLDVVRINRGLLEVSRRRLDLVEVVREVVASMQSTIEEKRHSLELALANEPIFIDGDQGRLDQVVTNLLENAIKFTDPGGQIRLTVEQRGQQAVLTVSDSGIGIPLDRLDRIFEPFVRGSSTLSRTGGGLGLGLNVVRRVVELHGGRVEARSNRGAGSEFVVWLPTAGENGGRTGQLLSALQTERPSKHVRRRVLVVDDRDEITKSFTKLLGAFGHDVAVAGDAASALTIAATFQPDCAILDLSLPDMSGYDLARELRKVLEGRPLLLIAFTGHENVSVREQCRAAGFDECLSKPGDPDVLEKLLWEFPKNAQV